VVPAAAATYVVLMILTTASGVTGPTTSQPASAPATRAAEPRARWLDAETGAVLFTSRDIVRFDWQRQLFELARERAIDLLCRPRVLRSDFVVRDELGEVYRGCFMSSESSMTFDGPTIGDGLLSSIRPPLYEIKGGYPGGGAKQALQAEGVLGSIDHPEKVPPIVSVFTGWQGGQHGLKVHMVIFPETFRHGRDARFVLRFAKDKDFSLTADEWDARVLLVGEGGGPFGGQLTSMSVLALPPETLEHIPFGNFAYRGRPWDVSISSLGQRVQAGPAELVVTITARRKTPEGTEDAGTWTVGPQKVEILPADKPSPVGATSRPAPR